MWGKWKENVNEINQSSMSALHIQRAKLKKLLIDE